MIFEQLNESENKRIRVERRGKRESVALVSMLMLMKSHLHRNNCNLKRRSLNWKITFCTSFIRFGSLRWRDVLSRVHHFEMVKTGRCFGVWCVRFLQMTKLDCMQKSYASRNKAEPNNSLRNQKPLRKGNGQKNWLAKCVRCLSVCISDDFWHKPFERDTRSPNFIFHSFAI